MKATIRRAECIGCGVCAGICPEVFEMDEESIAKVIVDPVPAEVKTTCKDAAANCPVSVIIVEE